MGKKNCIICEKEFEENSIVFIESNKPICKGCISRLGVFSKIGGNKTEDLVPTPSENVEKEKFEPTIMLPMEIKHRLDDYVVGQDSAKKILSVAAYNHYKRSMMNDDTIKKSNVLLIGPTGCGKTYLVQTLAKILDVPLANVPATNLTEVGYVGNDAESVVQRLLARAGGDIAKAEKGIVFIDEIDKLTSTNGSKREVGGKGVQQALLPIIEGTKVEVLAPGSAEPSFGGMPHKVTVDTSNILFICGGAFPDAEEIVKKRLDGAGKVSSIGFSSKDSNSERVVEDYDEENLLQHITTDDLKEFGMIPEFLGRLPVIASLKALDVDTLREILYAPKGSLVEQYRKLFSFDKIELEFEPDALKEIARKAYDVGTGARSLRTIMEHLLLDVMFSVPSDKTIHQVCITSTFVLGEGNPVFNISAAQSTACIVQN